MFEYQFLFMMSKSSQTELIPLSFNTMFRVNLNFDNEYICEYNSQYDRNSCIYAVYKWYISKHLDSSVLYLFPCITYCYIFNVCRKCFLLDYVICSFILNLPRT